MPDVAAILERLDQKGYRLTGQRLAVLEEVIGWATPFTSAELLETMQRRVPGIGRATVFRTLDLLTRLGVVQRIHSDPAGGRCHAYLACDDGHHHHLICSSCGRVTDFTEDKELEALVRVIEQRTAFKVEGHRLEMVGRCPACQ
ncbi:MAG: Fur family transcriptional regulator [Chloroflexia bacterium]